MFFYLYYQIILYYIKTDKLELKLFFSKRNLSEVHGKKDWQRVEINKGRQTIFNERKKNSCLIQNIREHTKRCVSIKLSHRSFYLFIII